MTIPLPAALPLRSSCQPGPPRAKAALPFLARGPYLALLRVGLAVPGRLPVPRWAFTPPFHHYPRLSAAVCSLWRYPSGYPGRALPGTLAFVESGLSSRSGFPEQAIIRPSARVRVRRLQPVRQRPGPKHAPVPCRDCRAGRSPRAWNVGGKRRGFPERLHRSRCASGSRENATASTSMHASDIGAKACPRRASRAQSNLGPGSLLRPGAVSEWPMTPEAGIAWRCRIALNKASVATICGSGNGDMPSLHNSIPIERELMSSTPCHDPAPACQAR